MDKGLIKQLYKDFGATIGAPSEEALGSMLQTNESFRKQFFADFGSTIGVSDYDVFKSKFTTSEPPKKTTADFEAARARDDQRRLEGSAANLAQVKRPVLGEQEEPEEVVTQGMKMSYSPYGAPTFYNVGAPKPSGNARIDNMANTVFNSGKAIVQGAGSILIEAAELAGDATFVLPLMKGRDAYEKDFDKMRNDWSSFMADTQWLSDEQKEKIADKIEFNLMDGFGSKDLEAVPALLVGFGVDAAAASMTGGASYFVQGYGRADEMLYELDPNDEISGDAKAAFKLGSGTIIGIFDKFGLEGLLDKRIYEAISRKVMTSVLKDAAKRGVRYSATELSDAVTKMATSVGYSIMRGGAGAAKGFLYEGGTELGEEVGVDGLKLALNSLNGKDIFDEAELRSTAAERYINAGAGGGIVGKIMGGVQGLSASQSYAISEMAKAETPEETQKVIDDALAPLIASGVNENAILNATEGLQDLAQLVQSLPKNLTPDQRTEVVKSINARRAYDDILKGQEAKVVESDEALREEEQDTLELMKARRKYLNNVIKEKATGGTYEYFEEDGNYFQRLSDIGKQTPITELEYREMKTYQELDGIPDAQETETTQEPVVNEGLSVDGPLTEQIAPAVIETTESTTIEPPQGTALLDVWDRLPDGVRVQDDAGNTGIMTITEGGVVEVEIGDQTTVLGNIEEEGVFDNTLEQFGFSEVREPEALGTFSFNVDGERYINRLSNPLAAITFDENGDVVSVDLEKAEKFEGYGGVPGGVRFTPATITGPQAERIALDLTLENYERGGQNENFNAFYEGYQNQSGVSEATNQGADANNQSVRGQQGETITLKLPKAKQERTFRRDADGNWTVLKPDGTPTKTKISGENVEYLNSQIAPSTATTTAPSETIAEPEIETAVEPTVEETPVSDTVNEGTTEGISEGITEEMAEESDTDQTDETKKKKEDKLKEAKDAFIDDVKSWIDGLSNVGFDANAQAVENMRKQAKVMKSLFEYVAAAIDLGAYSLTQFVRDINKSGSNFGEDHLRDTYKEAVRAVDKDAYKAFQNNPNLSAKEYKDTHPDSPHTLASLNTIRIASHGFTTSEAQEKVNPSKNEKIQEILDKYSQGRRSDVEDRKKVIGQLATLLPDTNPKDLKLRFPKLTEGFSEAAILDMIEDAEKAPPFVPGTVWTHMGVPYVFNGIEWVSGEHKMSAKAANLLYVQHIARGEVVEGAINASSTASEVVNDATNLFILTKGQDLQTLLEAAPGLTTGLTRPQLKTIHDRMNALSSDARATLYTKANLADGSTFTISKDNVATWDSRAGKWLGKDGKQKGAQEDITRRWITKQIRDADGVQLKSILGDAIANLDIPVGVDVTPISLQDWTPTTKQELEVKAAIDKVKENTKSLPFDTQYSVHPTQESYDEFVRAIGRDQSVGGKGIVVFQKGKGMVVHLSPKADADTVHHETGHGILYSVFRDSAFDNGMMSDIRALLQKSLTASGFNPAEVSNLHTFAQQEGYDGVNHIEFITELMAKIAVGKIKLENKVFGSTNVAKFIEGTRQFIREVVEFFGGKEAAQSVYNITGNKKDAIKFINMMAQGMNDAALMETVSKAKFDGDRFVKIGTQADKVEVTKDVAQAQLEEDNPMGRVYSRIEEMYIGAIEKVLEDFGSEYNGAIMWEMVKTEYNGRVSRAMFNHAWARHMGKVTEDTVRSGKFTTQTAHDYINEHNSAVVRKERSRTIVEASKKYRSYDKIIPIINRATARDQYNSIRGISDVEQAALVVIQGQLIAEREAIRGYMEDIVDKVGDAGYISLENEIKQLNEQIANITMAYKNIGTQAGRILAARAHAIDPTMYDADILITIAEKENPGLSITRVTRARLEKLSTDLQRMSEELRVTESQTAQQITGTLRKLAWEGLENIDRDIAEKLKAYEDGTKFADSLVSPTQEEIANQSSDAIYKESLKLAASVHTQGTPTPEEVVAHINNKFNTNFTPDEIYAALSKATTFATKAQKDKLLLQRKALVEQQKIIDRTKKKFEKFKKDMFGTIGSTTASVANKPAKIAALNATMAVALNELESSLAPAGIGLDAETAIKTLAVEIMAITDAAEQNGTFTNQQLLDVQKYFANIETELVAAKIESRIRENINFVNELNAGNPDAIAKIEVAYAPQQVNPKILRAREQLRRTQEELHKTMQEKKAEYALSEKTRNERLKEGAWKAFATTFEGARALSFMMDMSAIMVQGSLQTAGMIGQIPYQIAKSIYTRSADPLLRAPDAFLGVFWSALRPAWSAFRNNNYDASDLYYEQMRNSPQHYLREQAGLELTRPGDMYATEEAFATSALERIPFIGRIKKASEVHMATYLNLIRINAFDNFTRTGGPAFWLSKQFKLESPTAQDNQRWAGIVNEMTGRKNFELAGERETLRALSYFLAAPRLYWSRINMPITILNTLNPLSTMPARVRIELWKEYLQATIGYGLIYAALKLFGVDFEIGTDFAKSNLGQLTVGKETVDITGGNMLALRMGYAVGRGVLGYSSEKVSDRRSEQEGGSLRNVAWNTFKFRLHPGVTLAEGLAYGTDIFGNKVGDTRLKGMVAAGLSTFPIFGQQLILDQLKKKGFQKDDGDLISASSMFAAPLQLTGVNFTDYSDRMFSHPEVVKKMDKLKVSYSNFPVKEDDYPENAFPNEGQKAEWKHDFRKEQFAALYKDAVGEIVYEENIDAWPDDEKSKKERIADIRVQAWNAATEEYMKRWGNAER